MSIEQGEPLPEALLAEEAAKAAQILLERTIGWFNRDGIPQRPAFLDRMHPPAPSSENGLGARLVEAHAMQMDVAAKVLVSHSTIT